MFTEVLKRIEEEDAQESVWIVGPETGKMLYWMIRVVQPRVVLEVGTSVGYSALWMAAALEENKKGELWTIESHDGRFKRAQRNIEEGALGHRIHQIKGHAPEVFDEAQIPDEVDLVFLDATKMEHASYFEALGSRLKPDTYLVVDNVFSHRFGQMEKFIESLYKDQRLHTVEIPVGDGLLIARLEAV